MNKKLYAYWKETDYSDPDHGKQNRGGFAGDAIAQTINGLPVAQTDDMAIIRFEDVDNGFIEDYAREICAADDAIETIFIELDGDLPITTAAATLGSITSPRKASTSRENGKKGGRPRK